ncbi:glutamate transport system permease protein [Allocatelliglobosispora scoriae]|uniref:Glutamate transport system permease protein n=1 Tax=Allocatelliglobosispora scoriae TaxID=643052 RepID=A0A841C049_9ACTN|nr:amino acid ABC transporter permease [Allocatelliglobosispora scoriae]MBB5872330.1 glutamate transport system permease protein [Allocatelliglobosispora scoriae]
MSSVLYDTPGPRTRRITVIASILAAIALGYGLYRLVYQPLDRAGQLSMKLWGPIVDPDNKYFDQVWKILGDGWVNTLKAAGLSIVASLTVGVALALLRRQLRDLRGHRFLSWPAPAALLGRIGLAVGRAVSRVWVEVWRGTPVVTTLFFVFLVLPVWGIDFDDRMWFLVLGLTLYNSVVIGEILRSGMDNLPKGQSEAALAVGLGPALTSRLVLLPQAFRVMLPALISQVVVILKDTSLGGLVISYDEALGATKLMVEAFRSETPSLAIGIPMYFTIGIMYIAVNYLLSKLAQYVQRRVSQRGYRTAKQAVTPASVPAA